MTERLFTREEVTRAMNDGANLVSDLGDGARDTDLINMVINSAGHLLDKPDASLEDVIVSSYSRKDLPDDLGDEREETDDQMVTRIKGWIR